MNWYYYYCILEYIYFRVKQVCVYVYVKQTTVNMPYLWKILNIWLRNKVLAHIRATDSSDTAYRLFLLATIIIMEIKYTFI